MNRGTPESFGTRLKALRDAAGYTQEELATIAGLSVHAVSALERGERTRPHVETVRALSAALDLSVAARDALMASARARIRDSAADELASVALPVPLTAMVGRETDIERLQQWLGDPVARLITLVGPGGVGRTRLAVEVARAIDERGVTRVVLVPLAAIQQSALAGPAIAEALGLRNAEPHDLPRRVRLACAGRSVLLVVDNCEHLPEVALLLKDLLSASASLRVLATSRAPLHIRGERQYAVAPLALELDSAAPSIADTARAPAVQLFVERVRDVQPEFRLTRAISPIVTAICRRLDALPLALELAAPWIKVLTLEDLLHRLDKNVLMSAVRRRDVPERQQTMNTTVAWSYALLDSTERRAFRRLGVLPGRFTTEAATAVLADHEPVTRAPDALPAIANLIDKSLLHRVEGWPDRPLYEMFETVRAYAALELAAADERNAAMDGLARHCANTMSMAAEGLAGPEQAKWLDRVRDELENCRRVVTWLIGRARHDEACDIAWGLGFFFLIRGQTIEGLHWYKQLLELSPLSADSESKARVGAGLMYWAKGEFDCARSELLRALAITGKTTTTEIVVHAQNILGHIEHAAGNLDAARVRYVHSLEGFRRLGIPWGIGIALSGMGGVTLTAGDVEGADRLLTEATLALRESGPWFLAPVLCFRAVLALQRGEPDRAIALMHQSLTRIRALQDRFAFVYALVPLAMAAVLKGNHDWAARLLGARDAVAESTGAVIVDRAVEPLRETAEREARLHLAADGWARSYTAGRTASIDSLLQDIEDVDRHG
ncbi:MAG TPA: helix-turn-helix domain-containing protein [Vicinamibacterales bacterium]|nr:helix-turn-helix domain-containing protein [Vicinamibacterales bacterium]